MTTSADRARRYRQRQRKDCFVVRVEVDFDLVDALIETGWLAPEQSENRKAVSEAFHRIVSNLKFSVTRDAANRFAAPKVAANQDKDETNA